MSEPDLVPRPVVRPLRTRLLMLAASGLVPLVIVLAWGINHLVHERQEAAQRAALELSRALATAVDAELRSIAALLNQMTLSEEFARGDLRGFHALARRHATQLGWTMIALNDAKGDVLFRTTEPYGTSDPRSKDRDTTQRAVDSLRPVATPIIRRGNEAYFGVRVPVVRGGQAGYVLTAVIDADKIASVLRRQNIPSGSIASVFDQNLQRLSRSVQPSPQHPTPSLRWLLYDGGLQGTGTTTTPENVESHTGYARLADWGWVVVVSTSVEQTRQGIDALLRAVALGLLASLGLSALLALIVSRYVMGPIAQLKEAAVALGHGDPVRLPRLDIAELDDVAMALNNAAIERDEATLERNRAAQERERLTSQIAEALRAAKDANRSKDQFLAMLGHELRNPLAPIATAVQLMALKGDETTAQERRIIERQLVHVTRLVDDLLDVSRITSGRLTLQREAVRIAPILTHVAETIRASLFQRTLSLDVAPAVREAWVHGDEVRLAQVFNNLLVNAIKFTPAGGSIRLSAVMVGDGVRVDVEDSGIGIPAGELERVFELFYQGPQSADRAKGGLGLGLPIVKSLIDMHGGHVDVMSAGEGQGTCFSVWLPVCEEPAGSPEPEQHALQGQGCVLIVDDNHDAADTCATLLEISGYTTRVAYAPEEALAALDTFTPDVAILDIGLPGMSGYDLARALRERGYAGRLVALTGYGQAADVAASRAAGFEAHLTKPVSPDKLLDLLAGWTTQPAEQAS